LLSEELQFYKKLSKSNEKTATVASTSTTSTTGMNGSNRSNKGRGASMTSIPTSHALYPLGQDKTPTSSMVSVSFGSVLRHVNMSTKTSTESDDEDITEQHQQQQQESD
jgi:hypothetical protein